VVARAGLVALSNSNTADAALDSPFSFS